MKQYLENKNLPFNAILFVDNAGGHTAQTLNFDHPTVRVSYLPPRTTSILQPMDMGVIRSFKCQYQRVIYSDALKKMEENREMSIMEFWKQYDIRDAISAIKHAWEKVTPETHHVCWRSLWPECVNNFTGFPEVSNQIQEIVRLARSVGGEGFDEITEEDVVEFVNSQDEEPTLEELIQLNEDNDVEESDDDVEEEKPPFTIKGLRHLIIEANNLAAKFIEEDPILERGIMFKRALEDGLSPYKELLRSIENSATQAPITKFFKPSSAP